MYSVGCTGSVPCLGSKAESGQCSACGCIRIIVWKSLTNALLLLFLTALYILYLKLQFQKVLKCLGFYWKYLGLVL